METKKLFFSLAVKISLQKMFHKNIEIVLISDDDFNKLFIEQSKEKGLSFSSNHEIKLERHLFKSGFLQTISKNLFDAAERDIEQAFRETEASIDIPPMLRMRCYMWFRHGHELAKHFDKFSILHYLDEKISKVMTDGIQDIELPDQRTLDRLFKLMDRESFEDIDVDGNLYDMTCAIITFYVGWIVALKKDCIVPEDSEYNQLFTSIVIPNLVDVDCEEKDFLDYFSCFKYGYECAVLY